MTELLHSYINGNHAVSIYDDGTKISKTISKDSEYLTYDFPESFDFKITNRCNDGCKFCHENSTPNGGNPSLKNFLSSRFYQSIHPFTEMAIGGGNVFESKDLLLLLQENKAKNILSSITVSQRQLKENFNHLQSFLSNNLVRGLGVSISNPLDNETISLAKSLGNNVVFHVINGLVDESWENIFSDNKVLVLGFKKKGRGIQYLSDNPSPIMRNQAWLEKNLKRLSRISKILSFDCLAVSQLNPKKNLELSCNAWEMLYSGDDEIPMDRLGNIRCSTMFVDFPKRKIARSSISSTRYDLDLTETIETNFKKTFENANHCPTKFV